MGNYCSSHKKDKDTISEKSDESPSYQLAKSKKLNGSKEAPLADPEPTSDISNQITNYAPPASNNGLTSKRPDPLPTSKVLQSVASDSLTNSPLTISPPCDLLANVADQSKSRLQQLPLSLQALHGAPSKNRRTERDRKIVLYILAADDGHRTEKECLRNVYEEVARSFASRGYEVQLCDPHERSAGSCLDTGRWIMDGPLEARGGHHKAAPCLAEITRHSNTSYVIPILLLGSSLGSPLMPLTIESQDFSSVLSATKTESDRALLEKWYILDEKMQPQCYRLITEDASLSMEESSVELQRLLCVFVDSSTRDLCDSYLTTLVEQEMNNTVLINQELSKRCIWVQTGSWPNRLSETADSLETEMNRRLNHIHTELKNHLVEKNLIRIPPSVQIPIEQLTHLFETLICGLMENIVDEHVSKCQIPRCTFGVDANLLHEIEAVNQYSKILEQNCVNFGIMDRIKRYICTPSSEPLVVFGKSGCGKSVLSAKVAQNIHQWLPNCSFVLRYTKLTPHSSDIVSIIGSIAEQVCYLTKSKSCIGPHTIEFYSSTIRDCLEPTSQQLCILIDSVDTANLQESLDWLPTKLRDNVKIILTVTDGTPQLVWLKKQLSSESLVQLDQFSDGQWTDVLSVGGVDFNASQGPLILPAAWEKSVDKVPLQAKVFWWLAWLNEFSVKDNTLDQMCENVFHILEQRFGEETVRLVISLIVSSRYGLMETEILTLLDQSKLTKDDKLVSEIWTDFCWIMGPMLLHTDRVRLVDRKMEQVAASRYKDSILGTHKVLFEYYQNQSVQYQHKSGKTNCFNYSKFCELPYHAFKCNPQPFHRSTFLTDPTWIYHKLNATGCVHLLNDLNLVDAEQLDSTPHLLVLKRFLEQNMRPLNYDGRQFYSLMPAFVHLECQSDETLKTDEVVCKWLDHFNTIPIPYFETLGNLELLNEQRRKGSAVDATEKRLGYDVVANLGGDGYFVASMSVDREEICVWDVARCVKVRTLNGIPQPTSLCSVGDFGAAVLCRREIKVIDLDGGAFKVTLKGVMNQKMPFFGQHDSQHLVCLSRNRMYVNLMNLESGDCVTTFKAGEDRFLNSLLVSGDGRILVCGDETQKPFPLLVWHLSQRKLLYDLRIPHHDFVTQLSAITHEGAYVSVVAKELNEPTPNFIVVYDLQSGTLFKKWKPSCNTVSLAISQTNTCVIAGLEDARILIWDLVTGNCKYTLVGHSAPVTQLKLDPLGKILLSTDKEGRDLSVRLWELSTGQALAVHTPAEQITTCEILPNGKYVVIALNNHPNLVTLQLHQPDRHGDENGGSTGVCYGKAENEGKVFQL